jgi:DNA-binding CsgD family transcriptional regulator
LLVLLALAGEQPGRDANVVLVDRVTEMGVMRGLLDGVQEGSSGVLVLRGRAGIGKTALLREMAERAANGGMRTAQAAGIQAEMEFDFAGLHQLLLPFVGGLQDLPDPQRAALGTVFGLAATGQAPDRFLVGLATLTLLTDAAEKQPVLCVVDDAQWLDRVSLEMLTFVARRLLADRVGVVFGLRAGEERAEALSGFPELRVGPLPPEAGKELLETAAGGRVAESTSRRVLAEASGHPLALVELGNELATGRAVPDTAPGQPLRLGERLEWLYLNRVRELPNGAQTLLVLAAAEQLGEPETVWRAAEALGVAPEVAELPEVRRMLSLSPRVTFSHPLLRAAAYWGAPPAERRRVHAALAAVTDPGTDPDRRAWHLAEATEGPDEAVARELEASADRARGRGGCENEQAFLERAAQLTADPGRGAARRLAAAEAGLVAGDITGAEALAEQATPHLSQPLTRARARRVHGLCLQAQSRTTEAVRILVDAALEMSTADPRRAHDTMLEAFSAVQLEGWFGPESAEVALAVRRLPRPSPAAPGDGLLEGFAALDEGRTADGYALLRAGVRSMATAYDAPDTTLPRLIAWLQAAGLLFDHSAWADLERHWVPALRARGAVTALIPVLFSLGYNHLRAGSLSAAETALAEGRALAEGVGNREWLDGFNAGEVLLLALRGNVSEGRALAARLLGEPIQKQWRDVTHLFVAVLELGAGRYDAALDAALAAQALWPLLSPEDAVEAAVRCRRPEIAQAALDSFAPLAAAGGTPWALGVMARCRALLAGDDPGADDSYRQSIGYLEGTPVVLSLARSRLVYGEWQRRQRRRRDARDQLRAALESFERMGARGFAGRARAELAATGEHAMERGDQYGPRLTPQETQIARLAAAGVINRDIATQLFLSTATVDYHLRKVYRKLDVTRRASLPRALLDAGIEV